MDVDRTIGCEIEDRKGSAPNESLCQPLFLVGGRVSGLKPLSGLTSSPIFLAGAQQGMKERPLQTIPYGFLEGNPQVHSLIPCRAPSRFSQRL